MNPEFLIDLHHLTRRYGLTIDNLLAADLVLADGSFVTANEWQNEDLFWTIRGGGGNFGVVTSFLFRAQPVHTHYGGPMLWHLEDAPKMLQWYRDFIREAPDEITAFSHFSWGRRSPNTCTCEKCAESSGATLADRTRQKRRCCLFARCSRRRSTCAARFRTPRCRACSIRYIRRVCSGTGRQTLSMRSATLLSTSTMRHVRELPNMFSTVHLYPINGAASRVGKTDTAWSYRDSTWAQVIVGVDPDPANRDTIVKWAKSDYEDPASPLRRRRIRKLHDGRGRGSCQSELSR